MKEKKVTKKSTKKPEQIPAVKKTLTKKEVAAAAKKKQTEKLEKVKGEVAKKLKTYEKLEKKYQPKAPNANGKRAVTKPFKEIDIEKVKECAANGMSRENIAILLGISESTLYRRQKDLTDFADAIKQGRAVGDFNYSEALKKLALNPENPNLGAIIFYLKTRCGWVENPKAISDETAFRNEVLEQVRTHKITANEAAIMLDIKDIPIPDSIRMQASKEQPEPEDPTAGAYSSISEEEMAKQHAERMAERDRQRSVWLTERRQEVADLKEATKDADAFSPEKTGETK